MIVHIHYQVENRIHLVVWLLLKAHTTFVSMTADDYSLYDFPNISAQTFLYSAAIFPQE